jgi:hypothetical protein
MYPRNIHLAGPSNDNDRNCTMLILEDSSNCMEIKSTVRNVIAAPWIIADCNNLLAHFEDRKDELGDATILTSFSQIPKVVVVVVDDDGDEPSFYRLWR